MFLPLLCWFEFIWAGALVAPVFFFFLLLFFLIRALVALVSISLGALLHLFISNKNLCCSGFTLFGALVASVSFELEPLLLLFYFN